MTFSFEPQWLIGILVSYIGLWVAIGKYLFGKIDKRFDELRDRTLQLEKDFIEHKTKMPLEYQRREDAIRFETVLNAKLDAIGARIERLIERPTVARRATD